MKISNKMKPKIRYSNGIKWFSSRLSSRQCLKSRIFTESYPCYNKKKRIPLDPEKLCRNLHDVGYYRMYYYILYREQGFHLLFGESFAGKMKGLAFIMDPDGYWIEIFDLTTIRDVCAGAA